MRSPDRFSAAVRPSLGHHGSEGHRHRDWRPRGRQHHGSSIEQRRPAGSLAPHWPTFNSEEGKACKADAMGGNDTIRQLDDMYWIATERDMPMLKDYAVTQLAIRPVRVLGDREKGRPGRSCAGSPSSPSSSRTRRSARSCARAGARWSEYFQEFARRLPRYTPAMLDMANMGKMLGGSFMPGIEVGREGGRPQNWSLTHGATKYFPDLRFHPAAGTTPHPPGMLTKDLAIPWFNDFISCDETYWPTSRPQIVYQEQGFAYQWLHGGYSRHSRLLAKRRVHPALRRQLCRAGALSRM